jgi:hypothetical protein
MNVSIETKYLKPCPSIIGPNNFGPDKRITFHSKGFGPTQNSVGSMDYVRDGKIQGQCTLKRPKSGPVFHHL